MIKSPRYAKLYKKWYESQNHDGSKKIIGDAKRSSAHKRKDNEGTKIIQRVIMETRE